MKRTLVLAAIIGILWPAVTTALDKQKAQYVGGTVASLPLKAIGTLSTDADDVVVFAPDKNRGPALSVAYGTLTALDYGQKAGRGFGVNVRLTREAASSKKGENYLTMVWSDDSGDTQIAVFLLGEDLIPTALATLQARAGTGLTGQDTDVRRVGDQP